jgi:hypothetical protein
LESDTILHGRGSQYKYTKEYDKLKNKGMLNRTKLTDDELEDAEISDYEGTGRTNPNKLWIFDNIPIPADRNTKKVDRRYSGKYGD